MMWSVLSFNNCLGGQIRDLKLVKVLQPKKVCGKFNV